MRRESEIRCLSFSKRWFSAFLPYRKAAQRVRVGLLYAEFGALGQSVTSLAAPLAGTTHLTAAKLGGAAFPVLGAPSAIRVDHWLDCHQTPKM